MPYTVTMKEKHPSYTDSTAPFGRILSHFAVAELDELDKRIRAEYAVSINLPEQGGSAGPLPDGTVIDIGRTFYANLLDAIGINMDEVEMSEEEIVAAYNATKGRNV